ncbi:MAG: molybdenum cofactor guanylyltransferase [Methanocorpusculum sp.]|jgi:molybdopterin-guanine dinucleotide biosynthesis protein A|nr:molybdenum cofactor guanylyltransferase [Methanocorpusculum sp.]MDD2470762.1 molybdenum cofactor guanylyltransferase [Methanocorpusculum sp.]MDD3257311.1 molybdenum cofactor guanylyltransferase [Methanocorpusculum sp.]MDD4132312.1 molybdenum cofactor guanylyltransferase [Methanocorpusculum sp.]
MPVKRSAMILAGGEGRRVNGREKYFFSYKGCSFISRLVMTFQGLVDEIVIVAKNEKQTEHFIGLPDIVRCTWDKRPGLGPIGGISSGIDEVKGDMVFISACDMPTIHKPIVNYLFENIGDYDAIIPEWENTDLEPLHAVYKVSAVRKYMTLQKSLSLRDMVNSLNTKRVPPEMFRTVDPELESFRNVNTLDELLAMGPEASFREKHPEK